MQYRADLAFFQAAPYVIITYGWGIVKKGCVERIHVQRNLSHWLLSHKLLKCIFLHGLQEEQHEQRKRSESFGKKSCKDSEEENVKITTDLWKAFHCCCVFERDTKDQCCGRNCIFMSKTLYCVTFQWMFDSNKNLYTLQGRLRETPRHTRAPICFCVEGTCKNDMMQRGTAVIFAT